MSRITSKDQNGDEIIEKIVSEFGDKYILNTPNISKEDFKKEMEGLVENLINASMEKEQYAERNFRYEEIPFDSKKKSVTKGQTCYSVPGEMNTTKFGINYDYFLAVGLSSPDPAERMAGLTELVETTFHEFRHYKQYRAVIHKENASNYTFEELYKLSSEMAATASNSELTYKYENNYKNWFFEADARQAGKNESIKASRGLYNKMYKKYPQEVEKDLLKRTMAREVDGTVIGKKMSFFGKYGNRNDVISSAARYNIARHPSLTHGYGILGYMYNENGTVKTIEEIIQRSNEVLEHFKDDKNKYEEVRDVFDRIKADRVLYLYSKDDMVEVAKRLGHEKMNNLYSDIDRITKKDYESQLNELDALVEDSKKVNDGCKYGPSREYYNEIEKRKNELTEGFASENKRLMELASKTKNVKEYDSRVDKSKSLEKEQVTEYKATKLLGSGQKLINLGFKIMRKSGMVKQHTREYSVDMNKMISEKLIIPTIDDNVVEHEDIDLNSMLERVNELNSNIRQKENMTMVMKASKDEARDIISSRNKKIEDKQIGE